MWLRSLLLTGEQVRAARALARMDQAQLASDAGLSLETIKRLERIRGAVDANVRTIAAIVRAFEARGIEFESGPAGVTLRMTRNPGAAPSGPAPVAVSVEMSEANIAPPAPPLHRLIYCSTALPQAGESTGAVLDAILAQSLVRNAALDVTGALLAYEGRFLQALEGGKAAVLQIYGAICTDPRHTDLRLVQNGAVGARQFADWSLCAGELLGDEQLLAEPALAGGFRPDALSPAAALGLLSIVSDIRRRKQAA